MTKAAEKPVTKSDKPEDKPADPPVDTQGDGDQLDQATKQQPSTPPPPDAPLAAPLPEPKPAGKVSGAKALGPGSFVILMTGKYIGQLARIDVIDKPAETVKVSLETGGEPFTVVWPDGVRAAKKSEVPDFTLPPGAPQPVVEDDED